MSIPAPSELKFSGSAPVRSLRTGSWVEVADNEWAKICGKCGGTGYLPGYEFIDAARCWGCETSGFARAGRRTTKQLDAKARADERAAVRKAAKAAAEAEIWLAGEAERQAKADVEAAEKAALAEARRDASHYLDAAEGEKVEASGTVVLAHTYEAMSYNGFGTEAKRIVAVDCGEGVTVKMFTAAAWSFAARKGDEVTIAGTVKSHGEWEGVKETTLTRPRLISSVPAPTKEEEE